VTKTLDQTMIVDAVRGVTLEVCSTMLSLDIQFEEAYTETQSSSNTDGVVSFVGMAGSRVGTGSLACSAEVACRLASSFLMTDFDSVNDEVLDAFGELTNMVIGNLKSQVEEHFGPMGLSIPTVICGNNFSTRSLSHDEWTVVPFRLECGRLEVKICFKAAPDAAGPWQK